MFHSRGTVQSKTGVPVGTSCTSSGDVAAENRERLAHAVAGDAAADRVELGGERVDLLADASLSAAKAAAVHDALPCSAVCRSGVAARAAARSHARRSRVEDAVGHQLLDMADALVARPLELLQRQAGLAVGGVELLGAACARPTAA